MSISKHPHFEWNHFIHTDVSTQRWQVLWSSIRYDETIIMLVIFSADRSRVCSFFHAPVKQSCRTFMTNSPLCCQTMRKSWSLQTPVIPNVFRYVRTCSLSSSTNVWAVWARVLVAHRLWIHQLLCMHCQLLKQSVRCNFMQLAIIKLMCTCSNSPFLTISIAQAKTWRSCPETRLYLELMR